MFAAEDVGSGVDDPSAEELSEFDLQRLPPENAPTETWYEQSQVENRIFLLRRGIKAAPTLYREKHARWLLRSLEILPRGASYLDSLQGWAGFWIIHALDLLDVTIPGDVSALVVDHFRHCRDTVQGGYGGGPGQSAHLVSTFSVVMALCALGSDEALRSIDVGAVGRFVKSMKRDDGAFTVSEGGETDVRGTYSALAVASLLGLLNGEEREEYTRGSAEYLKGLQGFDGGLGGEAGAESHGGNGYCGVSALAILDRMDIIDRERLLDWAVMRQMNYEGGFQGRTNKLVDSCYSFWVGGIFAILGVGELFDAQALQKYVLECCQVENGGLRDKPGTARDLMHTCYALSGLSIAQHYGTAEGGAGNRVKKTDAVYNLSEGKLKAATNYFQQEAKE